MRLSHLLEPAIRDKFDIVQSFHLSSPVNWNTIIVIAAQRVFSNLIILGNCQT